MKKKLFVSELYIHSNVEDTGADPGFFLGGGAPLLQHQ